MWPLKGLFQTTSGASTYLVHPPGIKASAFICFNNFVTSSVTWALKVSQANKRFLRKNISNTCLKNFKASASFIQPFKDDGMMTIHQFLNSYCCCFTLITLKSNNPAGSYMFKVNNRNTRTRCEIYSRLTIKIPERRHRRHSGINRHIPNHVRPNGSFVHCNYTIW